MAPKKSMKPGTMMSENRIKQKNTKITDDKTREKCYNIFLNTLDKYNENMNDEEEVIEDIAFQLEKGVFDKFPGIDDYKMQSRSILSNITYTPNAKEVRNKIFNKEWDPYVVGGMDSKQLYPEMYEKILKDEKDIIELKERLAKEKFDSIDSGYKCMKCKSNKVDHYQKQTRSSDEPMTVFCHCLECDKRWKC